MSTPEEDYETTGKQVAESIGNTLAHSGALDHLVERGKDPDPDAVYIYNHSQVWKKGATFMEAEREVHRGERKVHKVRRGDRDVGFEFEFTDAPGIPYHCNYGWAFVLDTPENADYLKTHYACQAWIRQLEQQLRAHLTSISLAT